MALSFVEGCLPFPPALSWFHPGAGFVATRSAGSLLLKKGSPFLRKAQ